MLVTIHYEQYSMSRLVCQDLLVCKTTVVTKPLERGVAEEDKKAGLNPRVYSNTALKSAVRRQTSQNAYSLSAIINGTTKFEGRS